MKRLLILFLSIWSIALFGQKPVSTLQTEATTIRDEHTPGANTAIRVGGTLLDMVNGLRPIIEYHAASGTNTYAVTVDPTVTSYIQGQTFGVVFVNGNTGASTLNINGIGALSLTSDGTTAISSGTIAAGQSYDVYYNGTNLQLKGGSGSGGGGTTTNALSIAAELISGGASSFNGSTAKSIAIQPISVTNSMLAGSIDLTTKVGSSILPPANGGTGISPTGYGISITTAAGITTLTSTSPRRTRLTGSTTQTIVMPVVTTLSNYDRFYFNNTSTGVITIQSSGTNQILQIQGGGQAEVFVIDNTAGTGTASWDYILSVPLSLTTTGTSGAATFNTTTGVINIPTPPALPANALGFLANNGAGSLSWTADLTNNQNGISVLSLTNTTNSGGNAAASIRSIVDGGIGQFTTYSSTYSATASYANKTLVYNSIASGGLVAGSLVGIEFVTGGNTLSTNTRLTISSTGTFTFQDAINFAFGGTTGTKIGTSSNHKIGFWNATPIIQPTATTEIGTVLSNAGIRAAGTAYPITTSGAVNFTGGLTIATTGLTITDVNIIGSATTGTKIGTSTSQKWGFFNATPVAQQTTAVTAAAFVANTSGTVNDSATFGGYTIGQVVAALKALGFLQ